MDSSRRYSEEEIAQILDYATEVQDGGGRSLSSGTGMTLAELQDIGREVGISSDVIADAASRLDRPAPSASPSRQFLGATIGVGRTIQLSRPLTDGEWNRLVVDLRETFDARGRLKEEGSFRQWTNGNLQALLEPTESGERLRLRTLKGDARASLGIGAGMLLMALVASVLLFLTGAGDPGTPLFLGLMGALMYGVNLVRLPRWAAARELQMEGVTERLAGAMDAVDQTLLEKGG